MVRRVGDLAALAIALVSLAALPLAAGEPVSSEPLDQVGPDITDIVLTPNPVLPGAIRVNATATDLESNVGWAEFWIDRPGLPGSSSFRMSAADVFDSPQENVYWFGPHAFFTAGIAPGDHILLVHARDVLGNWGPFAIASFIVADPATTGPIVTSASATPADLPLGTDLVVEASLYDPFSGGIQGAEFFVDVEGDPGTGYPMAATGGFGDPSEVVTWTGLLSLSAGTHPIWIHGLNDRMVWGAAERVDITLRAPSISLLLTVDREEAGPGELVTYTIAFENRGNAAATEVGITASLGSALSYFEDTAPNGTSLGPMSWRFSDVAPNSYSFTMRAKVSVDARDSQALSASASLDFTNENGWDFPEVSAFADSSVIAPELSFTIQAPEVVHASEAFALGIDLLQVGLRTIPLVEVIVDAGPLAVPLEDTSGAIGGEFLGGGRWRFSDLPPGSYGFVIREQVRADAMDRTDVSVSVSVRYTSRFDSLVTLQKGAMMVVARPSLDVSITPSQIQLVAGEQGSLQIDYVNRGTASARNVEIALTLPDGLEVVGGDTLTASSGSRHAWSFLNVSPGASGHVTLVARARMETTTTIRLEVMYTSPNGGFLEPMVISVPLTIRPAPAITPAMAVVAVAGTSLLLGAVVATERAKAALLFLLFLPLYTRLRHDKILDHETRGMIRGYIVANPGDHYNSIKETLELPNGTLAYHLQVLQKEMIVRSVKDGKFRRFYPAEMRIPEGREPTKIQRVILELIRTNPGISSRDAAGLLGLSSSTVSYHLEKLVELGRVEYRREGIKKRLYVQGDLGV